MTPEHVWRQSELSSVSNSDCRQTITLSDSLCNELHCEAWFTWADRQPDARTVRVIGGTGLYIPDWLAFSDPQF